MGDTKVVSTMVLVLQEFLNSVETKITGLHSVYDEDLTVETALKRVRSQQDRENTADKPAIPLFAFRRSAIRPASQGMGRRSVTNRAFTRPTTGKPIGVTVYKAIHGEFDVEYMLLQEKALDEEVTEIGFLGEESVTDQKEYKVEIPDLGTFSFFAQWGVVGTKQVNQKDIYYKAMSGKVTIQGWFFILKGAGKTIQQIDFQIREFNQNVLMDTTIP